MSTNEKHWINVASKLDTQLIKAKARIKRLHKELYELRCDHGKYEEKMEAKLIRYGKALKKYAKEHLCCIEILKAHKISPEELEMKLEDVK